VYDLCKGKKVCEGDETALTKKEDEEEEDANAGKLAKKKKKTKGRHGCGSAQPKIMKDGTRLRADYSKAGGERTAAEVMEGDKKQMSAQHVYELFKGISNEDCIALGLNPKYSRPDWMICSVFPVPPPHVRPSVYSDTAKYVARAQSRLPFLA
jgi:DNA-directed RNA polymerase II subunit RPB1